MGAIGGGVAFGRCFAVMAVGWKCRQEGEIVPRSVSELVQRHGRGFDALLEEIASLPRSNGREGGFVGMDATILVLRRRRRRRGSIPQPQLVTKPPLPFVDFVSSTATSNFGSQGGAGAQEAGGGDDVPSHRQGRRRIGVVRRRSRRTRSRRRREQGVGGRFGGQGIPPIKGAVHILLFQRVPKANQALEIVHRLVVHPLSPLRHDDVPGDATRLGDADQQMHSFDHVIQESEAFSRRELFESGGEMQEIVEYAMVGGGEVGEEGLFLCGGQLAQGDVVECA